MTRAEVSRGRSDAGARPGLHVQDSLVAAAAVAAEIAALVRAARAAGRSFVLGCATGSSQHAVYAALVALHQNDGLSLRGVVTFNLDEYLGYGPDSEHSFASYMDRHLFQHVDIAPQDVHRLRGEIDADEIEAHCQAYEAAIEAAGGIDLQLLGVGSNGHIAFNEPSAPLDTCTRRVQLDEDTRRAARAAFAPHEVPRAALTMGVATIMKARHVRLLAFGAHKAAAVRRAFVDPIGPAAPVTALRRHRDAVFHVDEPAAAELPADLLQPSSRPIPGTSPG